MNAVASSGPGLSIPGTIRLGLFQACLGFLAVIFAGLLNRVMVSELSFPGILVGGALAFEQFVAPSRVLFGQLSDRHAWAGRHRLPYILLGAACFCSLAVLVVPVIFHLARALQQQDSLAIALGASLLCGLFACYGLSVSMASTPYLALVIDRTGERDRSRAVGIIWCMLTVGIVAGAVAISLSLRGLDGVRDPALLEAALGAFMRRAAGLVFLITLLATWGMEPRSPRPALSRSAERDDAVTLKRAWQLITSSRQVAIFFAFLILFTLALFLQDPVLESYGAEVFGMPIAATAGLNALWGTGTLLGLLLAGWWIVPRLGPLATARLGCQLIAASMLLLLLAGLTAQVTALKTVMLVFGLASGIGTNSTLCLMLDLTLPEAAGTFVGVWGLAQAASRALGKVLGGGLLDLGRAISPADSPFPPFAVVLSIEALVALVALWMLGRVNLRQFREDTSRSLAQVLSLELG